VFPCEREKATACAKAAALIRGKSLKKYMPSELSSYVCIEVVKRVNKE